MSFILDTDHCIAILRKRLNVHAHVGPSTPLFATAITVSELVYGAYKSDRRDDRLAQVNLLIGAVSMLPFDEGAARRCGELRDTLRRAGTPLSDPDLQIASISLYHAIPLVTHNQRHFKRVPGLTLLDWLA